MIIGQSQSQSVGEKILQEERDHGWQRGQLDLLLGRELEEAAAATSALITTTAAHL